MGGNDFFQLGFVIFLGNGPSIQERFQCDHLTEGIVLADGGYEQGSAGKLAFEYIAFIYQVAAMVAMGEKSEEQ